MQPNNVGNGGAQPVSPVRPVNPVSQAKPVEPVKAAAPASGPTFDNGPSVVEPKGGRKIGWIIGLVLMALIAAGGIGFGVWAWMDGNTQKDALNEQISALKKQNNELSDKIVLLNEQIESMSNNSANGNGSNLDDGDVSITAEVVDGVLYIKDSDGEVLINNSTIGVTELVSCEYFAEGNNLKCAVMVGDSEGWILYSLVDKSLTSSFDKN